jgi:hypothetical protein
MGFRKIDDPAIDAPAVSVNHLLLLAGNFTGDQACGTTVNQAPKALRRNGSCRQLLLGYG